jgi:hypothetical protein
MYLKLLGKSRHRLILMDKDGLLYHPLSTVAAAVQQLPGNELVVALSQLRAKLESKGKRLIYRKVSTFGRERQRSFLKSSLTSNPS